MTSFCKKDPQNSDSESQKVLKSSHTFITLYKTTQEYRIFLCNYTNKEKFNTDKDIFISLTSSYNSKHKVFDFKG